MTEAEANEKLINKHDFYFNNPENFFVTRYAAVVKRSNDNDVKDDYVIEIAYTNGVTEIEYKNLILTKLNLESLENLVEQNLISRGVLEDEKKGVSKVIFTKPFYYQNTKVNKEDAEYTHENQYKGSNKFYDKLTGGISIKNKIVSDEGTAGAFFKTKKDNTIYLLSNYHVLRINSENKEGRIYHQGKNNINKTKNMHIGDIVWEKPISKKYVNTIDAAVVKVKCEDFINIGRFTRCPDVKFLGIDKPKIGQNVRKCGRTSGITFGEIRSVNCTINISENDNELNIYRKQILTTLMTKDGDSGSVLVNDKNKVVGLLFAGNNYSCSVANPIKTIFKEIRNDIKDFKFKKFV